MMLRTSSTPILRSLLPSISPENPNNHHNTTLLHPYKSSFHQTPSPGSQHFTTLSSCNGGLRRAQSEGNLEGNDDALCFSNPPKKLSTRLHCSLLETIPSFSYHNSTLKSSDDEERDEENGEFGCKDVVGGGRNLSRVDGGEEGGDGRGDNQDVEEHYRKMVDESPGNSLLLGNYARFLYESKHDLQGAEEYYSRAIIIDPNDGGNLSQYAKLSWELHRDKERATSYFERAVQTASEDSHVQAAYASFLWEVEDEEDEETVVTVATV